jgi:hypothetical protein
VFFLGYEGLDIEAAKTEPWKSELVIVLEVNDVLVECETLRETYPRGNYHRVSIEFDADSRKDYKKQAACVNRLES